VFFDAAVLGRTLRVGVRAHDGGYAVSLDGREIQVDVAGQERGLMSLLLDGRSYEVAVERDGEDLLVHFPARSLRVALADASAGAAPPPPRASGPARLTAPMPGRVVRVLVADGALVEAGQGLVVVEAMKMENELRAPRAGCVEQVAVSQGQAVEAGALLLVIA
jgi:biotin carboxyl carrier protein